MTKLIKKEGEIIRKDLNRTRMRFSPDYQASNIQYAPVEEEPKLLTTKTKVEILNNRKEHYKNKQRNKKDYKSKYESVLNIIENVNDKVYFEDYTEEDFDEIFYQIVETPNGINAKSFFNKYPLEYIKIIEESKKAGKYVPQTCSTLEEKVGRARTFFNYCFTKHYIKTNYLSDLEEYGKDVIQQFSLEEKERTIITSYQLNKMFLECDIFKIRDIYHNQPSIFLVPLITLFTGTRLNELCGLRKEDVKDENGIFYFSISDNNSRNIKSKKGNRKVPIHSFLINELKILDYVNKLSNNSLLFPDLEDKKHMSNGYGASVSKVFNRLKIQFLTEEDLELNKIDFHSLRTTFITRLHMGEVEEALINGLSGHKQNTMSYKRYITCELMRLQKEIEKLYIEDIMDNLKIVSQRILDLKFY